eukprot:UN24551
MDVMTMSFGSFTTHSLFPGEYGNVPYFLYDQLSFPTRKVIRISAIPTRNFKVGTTIYSLPMKSRVSNCRRFITSLRNK